jgi:hypothetical protein
LLCGVFCLLLLCGVLSIEFFLPLRGIITWIKVSIW